jgi:hypothetical protein
MNAARFALITSCTFVSRLGCRLPSTMTAWMIMTCSMPEELLAALAAAVAAAAAARELSALVCGGECLLVDSTPFAAALAQFGPPARAEHALGCAVLRRVFWQQGLAWGRHAF